MSLSLVDLWAETGPFARGIVALLTAMSLLSLATAIERLLAVRTAAHVGDRFVPNWRAAVDTRRGPPSA